MAPNEQRSRRVERNRRGTAFTLVLLLIGVVIAVVGWRLYTSYQPQTVPAASAACQQQFSTLDAVNANGRLEYGEFLAYEQGLSSDDFSRADANKDQVLSLSEFCAWSAQSTG